MSVDATRWAWTAPVKSSAQRLVLLSLADRAGEYHTCFPSVARITKDTHLNRKTIMKVISELCELGLVEDTGHRKGITKQVVVYRLIGVKTREDDEYNSPKNGTVPKTEQYQNYQETVPFLPHNSPKNGTQNLKGTKKESKTIIKFNFAQELKNLGAETQLISDWMLVRKNKKASNTETAFNGFKRELAKSNLDVSTALKICIERNWQGFNSSWLSNINLSEFQNPQLAQQPQEQSQPVFKGVSKHIETVANDTVSYTGETAIEKVQSLASSLDSDNSIQETLVVSDIVNSVMQDILDRHQKIHDGIEVKIGIKTGFIELDNKLDRIDKTDLVIIGARPSMGKTTLAQNMMLDLAVNHDEVVLFMSGEMNKEQIMERMISGLGQIDLKKVRSAQFDEEGAGCIYRAVHTIQKCPIYINDKASPSLGDIRREARKIIQKTGRLNAIFVDYLQIMTPPEKTGNKVQEIGDISWGLKKIAKDFGCPVIALSQLNRTLENRPNKRPVMSDIRESGAIEQDADIIMFIYRDEVYNKDSKEAGTAEIIIGKARNGSTGTVRLATDLGRSSFTDLSPEYYQQMQGLGGGV